MFLTLPQTDDDTKALREACRDVYASVQAPYLHTQGLAGIVVNHPIETDDIPELGKASKLNGITIILNASWTLRETLNVSRCRILGQGRYLSSQQFSKGGGALITPTATFPEHQPLVRITGHSDTTLENLHLLHRRGPGIECYGASKTLRQIAISAASDKIEHEYPALIMGNGYWHQIEQCAFAINPKKPMHPDYPPACLMHFGSWTNRPNKDWFGLLEMKNCTHIGGSIVIDSEWQQCEQLRFTDCMVEYPWVGGKPFLWTRSGRIRGVTLDGCATADGSEAHALIHNDTTACSDVTVKGQAGGVSGLPISKFRFEGYTQGGSYHLPPRDAVGAFINQIETAETLAAQYAGLSIDESKKVRIDTSKFNELLQGPDLKPWRCLSANAGQMLYEGSHDQPKGTVLIARMWVKRKTDGVLNEGIVLGNPYNIPDSVRYKTINGPANLVKSSRNAWIGNTGLDAVSGTHWRRIQVVAQVVEASTSSNGWSNYVRLWFNEPLVIARPELIILKPDDYANDFELHAIATALCN